MRRKILSFPIAAGLMPLALGVLLAALVGAAATTASPAEAELMSRFKHLSENGNSNCSTAFLEAIATMPMMSRIKGSCCSPMDAHRYVEQVKGLERYREITAIPADPYDIPAGLAQRLMSYYPMQLTPGEQASYDYAMANSNEKGPCCCRCWRWRVYGGLAKLLIREHGFTGEEVAKVWDLSDGCGGDTHYHG